LRAKIAGDAGFPVPVAQLWIVRQHEHMEHSTIIKSVRDGMRLEFSNRGSDFFQVSASNSDIHVAARVSSFEPRPSSMPGFFRDLAVHWQGWQGKKEWASLEGELTFTATSDSTGHTSLAVKLRPNLYPCSWTLLVTLVLEAGQLEQVATDIEKFFSHECAA